MCVCVCRRDWCQSVCLRVEKRKQKRETEVSSKANTHRKVSRMSIFDRNELEEEKLMYSIQYFHNTNMNRIPCSNSKPLFWYCSGSTLQISEEKKSTWIHVLKFELL